MNREEIIHKFETLRQWRRTGERAPHKPLLVLYAIGRLQQDDGRSQRDEVRLIPYSEIDENLERLLREFGPRRANYGTQYPFWRLQNDGIWEISDAHRIGQTASGDALRSDLIRYDVSGGFLDNIAHQLQTDFDLSCRIIQNLLHAHFPSSLHEDILQAVGIEFPFQIPNQQRSNINFRSSILRAYEYKCAVCGFDVRLGASPIALEASHIRWRQADGPDVVINGLALCSLHHKLFDRGAFTLSQQLQILVSDDAHGSVGFEEWLRRFHGEQINFPQRQSYYPAVDYISWHVREVFQGDYREL